MRTLEQIQIDESCDLITAQRIQERESNRRLGIAGLGACLLIGAFIASAFWCPMYLRAMRRENSMLAYLASTGQSFTNLTVTASFTNGFRFVSNTWVNSSAKLALPIAPTNLVLKSEESAPEIYSMNELEYIAFENGVIRGAIVERKHPSQLDGPAIVKEAFRGSEVEKHIGKKQPFVKVIP